MQNPYEYLGPLYPRGRGIFVGRERELVEAERALGRNGFVAVYAPPAGGTTSFLNALAERLGPRGFRVSYVDLADLAAEQRPLEACAKKVLRELRCEGDATSLPDCVRLVEEEEERCALFFDGFGKLPESQARLLACSVRAAYTESRRRGSDSVYFISGSSIDLRRLTSTGRTSPLNVARELRLTDLSREEVEDLVRAGLGETLSERDSERATSAIWEAARGHPFLSQLLASRTYDEFSSRARPRLALSDLIAWAEDMASGHLEDLGRMLSGSERLRETLARIGRGFRVPFDRFNERVRELSELGYVRRGEDGSCVVRCPVYEAVLARLVEYRRPGDSGTRAMKARCNTCGTEFASSDLRGAGALLCPECGLPLEVGTADELPGELPDVGEVVGGCEILELLGRGGMGAVFRARHVTLNKIVAFKTLSRENTERPRYVQRFLREARSAAKLEHENVTQVFNVGRDKGYYFMLMQYAPKGCLGDVLDEDGVVQMDRGLRWFLQSARGLEAAHGKMIVHRDIKPDNILIAADGTAKVSDFGLAAPLDTDEHITAEGLVVGTPDYMSPEQCSGREVDFRSDVYSLGATFYHAFCGRKPFYGESPLVIMMKHRTEIPARPKALRPEMPEELSKLLEKCLEKSPEDRPQTAGEIASALRRMGAS